MSSTNLGLIDTLLSNRLLKGVRRRSNDTTSWVELQFADGTAWSLVPNKGEEITAACINIMKKAQPITDVQFDWPATGTMGLCFWSGEYLLLSIRCTHNDGGGWPARLLRKREVRRG